MGETSRQAERGVRQQQQQRTRLERQCSANQFNATIMNKLWPFAKRILDAAGD
jgi:hypothetical protein